MSSQKLAALQQCEQWAPEHQVSLLASLRHFPRSFALCPLTKDLTLSSPEGNVSTGASKIYIKLFHSLKVVIDCCNDSTYSGSVLQNAEGKYSLKSSGGYLFK